MFEGLYLNGLLISDKGWKPNGQRNETNIVNGTGKSVEYYENGQKRFEETYKNGERISKKEWNEDGSVKE